MSLFGKRRVSGYEVYYDEKKEDSLSSNGVFSQTFRGLGMIANKGVSVYKKASKFGRSKKLKAMNNYYKNMLK